MSKLQVLPAEDDFELRLVQMLVLQQELFLQQEQVFSDLLPESAA